MSSNQSQFGCSSLLVGLVFLAIAYAVGLGLLGGLEEEGSREWWHYVVPLPCGLIWFWFYLGNGSDVLGDVFVGLLKWLLVPVGGIWLMNWLTVNEQTAWLIGGGIAFLSFAAYCAYQVKEESSAAWIINTLASIVLGIIMLVRGM